MGRTPSAFVAELCEALAPLGPVRARGMFGGFGLFLGERMFALVADDELFLKADPSTRPAFEAAGLEPFTYTRRDGARPVALSYWRAPAMALDDADELCRWARDALGAAERAAARARRPRACSGSGRNR